MTWPVAGCVERLSALVHRQASREEARPGGRGWRTLPPAAQAYVASVIVAGAYLVVTFFPLTSSQPRLFAVLLVFSCLSSLWKVHLVPSTRSGSTLSVSYAANVMALVLLGAQPAMIIAVAGVWTQCTFRVKQPNPAYRIAFSMAGEAITIQATAATYASLGGWSGPMSFSSLSQPLAGAIAAYFLVNTGLVAAAIALSTQQPLWKFWHDNFLWSAPSFIVAGSAGALAAFMTHRGTFWLAILMLAPVYLTYRTYHVFLGRIEDERRHAEETLRLHAAAVEALALARRAEQALTDEKERLSVTLRNIGDGVITTDPHGTILLMNHAAERLTGWTQDDALGKPLGTVFRNVDRQTRERCDNSLATLTHSPDPLELTRCTVLVARDLTEHPIEERVAPLRDAAGRSIGGMVVAFRDISDVIRAQEERARADKFSSLGLLAGSIAHDFNDILMAILGHVSMARAAMPPTMPVAGALGEAEHGCLRARQLTWQLLTFAKGAAPVKRTIALAPLLQASATLALRGSNVRCVFHIAPDLWLVHADEEQLMQLFNNVLINGQQATPPGGVIEIRAQNVREAGGRDEYALRVEAGPYVRISIIDTGGGIPEEDLGSIFDPYFSTKQEGRGLGLATSYSIVKSHGGYLSVESTLGHGTTMHVNLPALVGRVAQESPEPVGPRHPDAGVGRILVMDDEASIRTLVINMLEFLGYDAEAVIDGIAAVQRYQRALAEGWRFDAVVLDLVVPGGIGGTEALRRLANIDPAVKAILASGYTHDPALTDFREHGFQAAIAKPFTLEELARTLHAVVPARTYRVH